MRIGLRRAPRRGLGAGRGARRRARRAAPGLQARLRRGRAGAAPTPAILAEFDRRDGGRPDRHPDGRARDTTSPTWSSACRRRRLEPSLPRLPRRGADLRPGGAARRPKRPRRGAAAASSSRRWRPEAEAIRCAAAPRRRRRSWPASSSGGGELSYPPFATLIRVEFSAPEARQAENAARADRRPDRPLLPARRDAARPGAAVPPARPRAPPAAGQGAGARAARWTRCARRSTARSRRRRCAASSSRWTSTRSRVSMRQAILDSAAMTDTAEHPTLEAEPAEGPVEARRAPARADRGGASPPRRGAREGRHLRRPGAALARFGDPRVRPGARAGGRAHDRDHARRDGRRPGGDPARRPAAAARLPGGPGRDPDRDRQPGDRVVARSATSRPPPRAACRCRG